MVPRSARLLSESPCACYHNDWRNQRLADYPRALPSSVSLKKVTFRSSSTPSWLTKPASKRSSSISRDIKPANIALPSVRQTEMSSPVGPRRTSICPFCATIVFKISVVVIVGSMPGASSSVLIGCPPAPDKQMRGRCRDARRSLMVPCRQPRDVDGWLAARDYGLNRTAPDPPGKRLPGVGRGG